MELCESTELIRLKTYAPVVKNTERPVPLNPTGKRVGLSEPGDAGSANILEMLPDMPGKLYKGKVCLIVPE